MAYETLPEAIKQRIAGRKALNAYDYDSCHDRVRHHGTTMTYRPTAHPVVRTHPATGRKALYVNRLMTREIEGLPTTESDELSNTLFDHQEQRTFVYEHVWRPATC